MELILNHTSRKGNVDSETHFTAYKKSMSQLSTSFWRATVFLLSAQMITARNQLS
jgi:hypothetical protein